MPAVASRATPVPQTPVPGESWLIRLFPLQVVLPAGVIAAGCAIIVIACGGPLLAALGGGTGTFIVGLLRFRGSNIWKTLVVRTASRRRRGHGALPEAATEPFDITVPDSGGAQYGMRWDGRCVVSMLRVDQRRVAPTLLSPESIDTAAALPLPEVAKCLSQFDIRLAAIDVITRGTRTPETHETAQVYEQLLGPLPATANRTTWLLLRLDPLQNSQAIDSRGGGLDGTVRIATVATRRVVDRLAVRGFRAQVLTASEMNAATRTLAGVPDPANLTEERDALRHGDNGLSCYEIRPGTMSPGVLASVSAVPGTTTASLRLAAPNSRDRAVTGGRDAVAVSAMVCAEGPDEQRRTAGRALARKGLRLLAGAQRHALLAGLALASTENDPTTPARFPAPEALADFAIPVGGCGQLVGATEAGQAVAVPLFGSGVRHVEICGDLSLVRQTVLRSVALGARVLVHTARPREWDGLISRIAAPQRLSLSGDPAAAQHTAAATMVVCDKIEPAGPVPAGTVLVVRPVGSTPQQSGTDVILTQSATHADRITIRTAEGEVEVRTVAIPAEREYLAPELARIG